VAVHIFGIRHHGPGCARSLQEALAELAPDIVLVEGPPEAHPVLPLLIDEGMRPPVALLIYAPEAPQRAAFYPFAHFSPEWQALRYALQGELPARFIDLPQAVVLAQQASPDHAPATDGALAADQPTTEEAGEERTVEEDPIALLAEAAGYADHELWWEHQIEQRRDAHDMFAGIMEAMQSLRAEVSRTPEHEARREAHMRQAIRDAEREGFQRIAVVCGAWHAPALQDRSDVKSDAALLAKLPRVKVEATWSTAPRSPRP